MGGSVETSRPGQEVRRWTFEKYSIEGMKPRGGRDYLVVKRRKPWEDYQSVCEEKRYRGLLAGWFSSPRAIAPESFRERLQNFPSTSRPVHPLFLRDTESTWKLHESRERPLNKI